MSLFLLIFFIIVFIAGLISVIRIAIYGGSFLKPDFRKALEHINKKNEVGKVLLENSNWIKINAVAYYLILLFMLAFVGGIIYWLMK